MISPFVGYTKGHPITSSLVKQCFLNDDWRIKSNDEAELLWTISLFLALSGDPYQYFSDNMKTENLA